MPHKDPERLRQYRRERRAANRGRLIEETRIWRLANPDRVKTLRVAYYASKRDVILERNRKYRDGHLAQVLERQAQYREARRKKANERSRQWRKANPGWHRAQRALRKTRKLQATPRWLTADHLEEMRLFYINCPPGHHVDHIHPLKGIGLCGLHVPWNLQYLPARENLCKGNRL
jgi:hypothetical protein